MAKETTESMAREVRSLMQSLLDCPNNTNGGDWEYCQSCKVTIDIITKLVLKMQDRITAMEARGTSELPVFRTGTDKKIIKELNK